MFSKMLQTSKTGRSRVATDGVFTSFPTATTTNSTNNEDVKQIVFGWYWYNSGGCELDVFEDAWTSKT